MCVKEWREHDAVEGKLRTAGRFRDVCVSSAVTAQARGAAGAEASVRAMDPTGPWATVLLETCGPLQSLRWPLGH